MNSKNKKENLLCDVLFIAAAIILILAGVFLKDSDALLLIACMVIIFTCLFLVLMVQLKIILFWLFNREKKDD